MGSAVDSTCRPADIESLGSEDVPIKPTAKGAITTKTGTAVCF